jgi:hypothetical protein
MSRSTYEVNEATGNAEDRPGGVSTTTYDMSPEVAP